jgi:Ca2+-binding EF-hand superfamily protein
MGAIASVLPSGVSREWMEIFKAMKLTREEVCHLLAIYHKVDCDKSGNIDVVELLTLLDIERTSFTEKIFCAFDKDRTGQIDFYEFVVSVWKFCTLGNGAISKPLPLRYVASMWYRGFYSN